MSSFLKYFSIVLFSVLFYTIDNSAQDKYDFIIYHKKINTAEIGIAKMEYKNSLEIYQDIFKRFPHAFYKDYHNAVLCAIKENDFKNAVNYSKALVLHGYEVADFEKSALDELKSHSDVWRLFLSEYPDLREKYENSINLPLREKYLALFTIDQKAASSENIKYQDSIFNKLAGEVSALVKKHGFPHWFINKDTISFRIQVMLRHYCGLANRIKFFEETRKDSFYIQMQDCHIEDLVYNALREGWLTPEQYVSITTYYQSPNPYGKLAVVVDYEKETVKLNLPVSSEQQDEINKKRDNIGLPTIAELSDEMLAGTRWSRYPFKRIKEAWIACDTCNWMSYDRIETSIRNEVENEYEENKKYDFILNDYDSINEIWVTNTQMFQKNKISLEELEGYDFNNQ